MGILRMCLFALAGLWGGAQLHASTASTPFPELLSDYGVVHSDGKTLSLQGNTMVYSLASPLFTDYALKFRTLTFPNGARVGYRHDGLLDLPIGTIITKTFFYPRDGMQANAWLKTLVPHSGETIDLSRYQMVETRILRRDPDGTWQANTYVWDAAQTQAKLRRIGQTVAGTIRDAANAKVVPLNYQVPNARQCQTCHAVDATNGQAGIEPIGPKARLMNLEYGYAAGNLNQLVKMGQIARWEGLPPDLSTISKPIAYADARTGSLDARARAYSEINCAHCHNRLGDARQSGLFLTLDAQGSHLGVCKQHAAAGSGGAGLTFDIVPGKPDQSLFISRMLATEGQAMMPRVGRSLVDTEGIALLRSWISAMPGNCSSSR